MEKLFSLQLPNNSMESVYTLGIKFFGVLLFILLAWLLIKIVLFAVRKSLKISKAESKFHKLQKIINLPLDINYESVIVGFVKWTLILVLVTIGADILEFSTLSGEMGKIILYLPKLASALALLMVGFYLASVVKKSIVNLLGSLNLGGSKVVGTICYFAILTLFGILGANQAGVNTDVVTANLLLVMGAFIASFALAMGLGSRDIVLRLILGFYSRKNYAIGTSVIIDDFEGTITAIDNICMTVENEHQKIVYPIKSVANKKIVILK